MSRLNESTKCGGTIGSIIDESFPIIDESIMVNNKDDSCMNELAESLQTKLIVNDEVSIPQIRNENNATEFDPNVLNPVTFKPSRRSSTKARNIKNEIFTFDVYKTENRADFLTSRPFLWVKAFYQYVKENQIKCRWESSTEPVHGKCSEIKMNIVFMESKKVSMVFKLAAGSVMVKGAHHKLWIDNEFKYVKRCLDQLDPSQGVSTVLNTSSSSKSKANPINHNTNEAKSKTTEQSETDKIWSELDSLKTGLSTLGKSIEHLLLANRESKDEEEKEKNIFEDRMNRLRSTYDSKLTVFMSAISIECEDKIDKIKSECLSQNLRINKEMASIESRFQKKLNSINQVSTCKCQDINNPKWTDLELIRKNLNEVQQNIINDLDTIKFSNDSDNLRKEFKELHDSISAESSNVRMSLLRGEQSILNVKEQIKVLTESCGNLQKKTLVSSGTNTSKNPFLPTDLTHEPSVPSYSQPAITPSLPYTAPFNSAKAPSPNRKKTPRILICMDSNQKFIDKNRFWNINESSWKSCYTIQQVNRLFENETFSNELECVLISCGVNDIDSKAGRNVADELFHSVMGIHHQYPKITIVVNEITPRGDEKNKDVNTCNERLKELLGNRRFPSIYLQDQQGIRSQSCLYDSKHIRKSFINKFVTNLKFGLRRALKISSKGKEEITQQSQFFPSNYNMNFKKDIINKIAEAIKYI